MQATNESPRLLPGVEPSRGCRKLPSHTLEPGRVDIGADIKNQERDDPAGMPSRVVYGINATHRVATKDKSVKLQSVYERLQIRDIRVRGIVSVGGVFGIATAPLIESDHSIPATDCLGELIEPMSIGTKTMQKNHRKRPGVIPIHIVKPEAIRYCVSALGYPSHFATSALVEGHDGPSCRCPACTTAPLWGPLLHCDPVHHCERILPKITMEAINMTDEASQPLASAYDTAIERTALKHIWIPQMSWSELAEKGELYIFEHGDGIYLYDIHGRRFVDAMAGLVVVNIGHGRAELAEVAAEQMKRLAYISAAQYTSVPAVRLAERIAQLTPGDLERVFFCSGGSEAVETAIKIAKQVQFLRGFPKRYKIIARRGSYHGATFGAMSLSSNRSELEPLFGPFMNGVVHIANVDRYRNDFGLNGPEGDMMAARDLEQEIRFQGPETVAAFIGEPISTAAGCHVPTPAYWQEIRRICNGYGVLLIMDEVIDGWGRTGRLFAAEHFGVVPDIMVMAKGLSSGYAPIAAAVVRPSLFAEFKNADRQLSHLLTFGGHAVSCAISLKHIEILLEERLVEHSADMGEYLLAELRDLVKLHPSLGDARGAGLMCALELVKDKETREPWTKDSPFSVRLRQILANRGVLVRILGTLIIAPPLIVTREQIDDLIAILDEALTHVEAEFNMR